MFDRKDEVKMLGLPLHVDESMLAPCPFCGALHERTLSITRKADGLVYHCFRDSCKASGFVRSSGSGHARKPMKKGAKPYKGPVVFRDSYSYPFLVDRFEIDPFYLEHIGIVDEARSSFLLPVHTTRHGYRIGWQLRHFDGTQPKAALYFEEPGPYIQLATYSIGSAVPRGKHTAIIVEDYFSMVKVQQAADEQMLDATAISLLGTNVSDEVAAWLGKNYKRVVMMLDPDAYSTARKAIHDYQLVWPSVYTVLLEEDPKDTDMRVLQDLVLSVV